MRCRHWLAMAGYTVWFLAMMHVWGWYLWPALLGGKP